MQDYIYLDIDLYGCLVREWNGAYRNKGENDIGGEQYGRSIASRTDSFNCALVFTNEVAGQMLKVVDLQKENLWVGGVEW